MTNPDPPINVADKVADTNAYTIAMTWSEGLETGGSVIYDYRISYAISGTSTFTVLASSITDTTYSTTQLTSGSEYTFKIESRNAFGYSALYSTPVTILQAQVPDAPI
jgi:hypothetical protein